MRPKILKFRVGRYEIRQDFFTNMFSLGVDTDQAREMNLKIDKSVSDDVVLPYILKKDFSLFAMHVQVNNLICAVGRFKGEKKITVLVFNPETQKITETRSLNLPLTCETSNTFSTVLFLSDSLLVAKKDEFSIDLIGLDPDKETMLTLSFPRKVRCLHVNSNNHLTVATSPVSPQDNPTLFLYNDELLDGLNTSEKPKHVNIALEVKDRKTQEIPRVVCWLQGDYFAVVFSEDEKTIVIYNPDGKIIKSHKYEHRINFLESTSDTMSLIVNNEYRAPLRVLNVTPITPNVAPHFTLLGKLKERVLRKDSRSCVIQ